MKAQGVGRANRWDLPSRKLIERIPGDRGVVYSMAFSPDGREVALASEGLVEVSDVEALNRPLRALRGPTGDLNPAGPAKRRYRPARGSYKRRGRQ
jgi:WD40 repeat protein